MDKPDFDLEQVYDEQINPLMDKIIAICKDNKLPFVATFQCNSEGDRCDSAYLPEDRPIDNNLECMYAILMPKPLPMLKITTKDGNGNVKSIDLIQGV